MVVVRGSRGGRSADEARQALGIILPLSQVATPERLAAAVGSDHQVMLLSGVSGPLLKPCACCQEGLPWYMPRRGAGWRRKVLVPLLASSLGEELQHHYSALVGSDGTAGPHH